MYYPGSSGWIEKYIDLVEKRQIHLHRGECDNLFHVSRDSGLLLGTAIKPLFLQSEQIVNWTAQDQLKNLFFETLLWTYLDYNNFEFDKEKFITTLATYYESVELKNTFDFLSFFKKESQIQTIESAIDERLELDKRILETRIWLSTLNNAFVFLDVILFKKFLEEGKIQPFQELTSTAMHFFIGASHSDKEISESEEKLFSFFIACARLEEEIDNEFENLFKNPDYTPNLNDFSEFNYELKYYLLYFCSFIISCNREIFEAERSFLINLALALNLSEEEVEVALTFNTGFILAHGKSIPYLKSSSTEILFSNLTNRWGKILLRNKDKLILEIQQSKDLVRLLGKSTQKDLTKEEKELVKNQLMDIMRSMPSLAIFLIPGGSLLLPIFLKIIPGLMPSSFRDNEVSKDS